uniref:Uncharacterized protein n=1 Tax=Coccidioides posadasii RMSCC 3488 TaxID=454284 RepID=A0A0J6I1G5_COCPO|nr:hypothetical protein CPAG_01449 [Coccidioides posadasii RMSCC 3488]
MSELYACEHPSLRFLVWIKAGQLRTYANITRDVAPEYVFFWGATNNSPVTFHYGSSEIWISRRFSISVHYGNCLITYSLQSVKHQCCLAHKFQPAPPSPAITPGHTRSPPIPTARQACPKHPHIWIDVGDIPANSPPVAKIMATTANAARHSLGGLGHEYERIPNSGTS